MWFSCLLSLLISLGVMDLATAKDLCKTEVSVLGMALKGFIYKKVTITAPYDCDITCRGETKCQSFNYGLVKSPVNWALEQRKQGPRISSQTIHAFTWDASLAEVSIKCNSLYEQIFVSDSLWKSSTLRGQKCLNALFIQYSNTYIPIIFIFQSLEQNSPSILNQFPKNNIYYLDQYWS